MQTVLPGPNGVQSRGAPLYAICSLITTIFHSYMYTIHRRALEAKAAIYARLSGGDGVREGEEEEEEEEGEEPRYMVDFTRKIWEEVNTNNMHVLLLALTTLVYSSNACTLQKCGAKCTSVCVPHGWPTVPVM